MDQQEAEQYRGQIVMNTEEEVSQTTKTEKLDRMVAPNSTCSAWRSCLQHHLAIQLAHNHLRQRYRFPMQNSEVYMAGCLLLLIDLLSHVNGRSLDGLCYSPQDTRNPPRKGRIARAAPTWHERISS